MRFDTTGKRSTRTTDGTFIERWGQDSWGVEKDLKISKTKFNRILNEKVVNPCYRIFVRHLSEKIKSRRNPIWKRGVLRFKFRMKFFFYLKLVPCQVFFDQNLHFYRISKCQEVSLQSLCKYWSVVTELTEKTTPNVKKSKNNVLST